MKELAWILCESASSLSVSDGLSWNTQVVLGGIRKMTLVLFDLIIPTDCWMTDVLFTLESILSNLLRLLHRLHCWVNISLCKICSQQTLLFFTTETRFLPFTKNHHTVSSRRASCSMSMMSKVDSPPSGPGGTAKV